jgi:ABC-2 type transport system permease protein
MNLRKLWLVARNTYHGQVRTPMFLIMTIALPLLMVAAGLVPVLLAGRDDGGVVGYVDRSGSLTGTGAPAQDSATTADPATVILQPYPDTAAAEAAVMAGEISGYLVVPEDYLAGGRLVYSSTSALGESRRSALAVALRRALAPDAPPWLHERLNEGPAWRYEERTTGRILEEGVGLYLWVLLPFGLAMLFILLLTTTLSSMGPTVVREKDERAMEIVLTSLRTVELVGGKLVGLSLLTLTQLAIWLVGAAIAIGLVWQGEGQTGSPVLPWHVLGWGAMLTIPGYLLYGALAAALGIMAGSREQARQTSGTLSFLAVAPLFAAGGLLGNPDGPVAVTLTIIPLFAPVLGLFRMALTEVPAWQLWTAVALMWLSVLGAMWLAARLFRASALLYGQNLKVSHMWRALKAR